MILWKATYNCLLERENLLVKSVEKYFLRTGFWNTTCKHTLGRNHYLVRCVVQPILNFVKIHTHTLLENHLLMYSVDAHFLRVHFEHSHANTCYGKTISSWSVWIYIFREFQFEKPSGKTPCRETISCKVYWYSILHASSHWRKNILLQNLWIIICLEFQIENPHLNTPCKEIIFFVMFVGQHFLAIQLCENMCTHTG